MAGKYFYKSIPLREYCDLKHLDYIRVLTYIKSPERLVNGVTQQILLETLLLTYELYEEIVYNDEILSLYCIKRINKYHPILDDLVNATNGNPNLVTDELIENVLFRYGISGTKYFYNGLPYEYTIDERCLNKQVIDREIKEARRREPGRKVQSIVDEVMNRAISSFRAKYYFNNKPLKDYCKEHRIDYNHIINDANNRQFNPSGNKQKYITDMLTAIIPYEDLTYLDVPIKDYCESNRYSFYTIAKKSIIIKRENPDLSYEEALIKGVDSIKGRNKGIPKKAPIERPQKEKKVVPKKEEKEVEYFYNGYNLHKVCYIIGKSYPNTVKEIRKQSNDSNSLDDIISKQILDFIDEKIYINGELLLDLCLKNNYIYFEILNYIKSSPEELSDEEKYNDAVKQYKERRSAANIRKAFNRLKRFKNIDINAIKEICDIVNMDFNNVLENRNTSVSRIYDENTFKFIPVNERKTSVLNDYNIIMMIWYFYDIVAKGSLTKSISYKRFSQILYLFEHIEELKANNKLDLNNVPFELAYKLYKCGLYTNPDILLAKLEDIISSLKSEINDSNLDTYILDAINSCIYKKESDVKEYITKYVRKRVELSNKTETPKKYQYVPKKED